MKKAVIAVGGRQYLVEEGQSIDVNFIKSDKKSITFEPLLVIDGDKTTVGNPFVDGVKVSASILEESQGEKVDSIRYKAKKRVRTVRGHRQKLSKIKINSIK